MGTRNLVCVYYKGRFVVAQYGQWDGYPSGQGVIVSCFLRDPNNIARLKNGLEHVKLDFETKEDCAFYESHPALSRDTGAKILEMVASATAEKLVPLVLDVAFAKDSIFCEWCYVVDLDESILEVYAGFHEGSTQEAEKRFADVGGASLGYLKAFDLGDLPANANKFVQQLEAEDSGGNASEDNNGDDNDDHAEHEGMAGN